MTARTYKMITTEEDLDEMLTIVGHGKAALDFETTGLDPELSQVRLAQICNDDVCAVVDFWALPAKTFASYAEWFEDGTWIAFNAGFEYQWFDAADAPHVKVIEVAHARRARMGGDQMSLAKMLKAELNVDLPKDQQLSNWSADVLSEEQLRYAADDGIYTWDLWVHLQKKLDEAPASVRGAQAMFDALVVPVHEMQRTGLLLDVRRHKELVQIWRSKLAHYEGIVRGSLTEKDVANLNSGRQLSDFFSKILPDEWLNMWSRTEKTGELQMTTKELKKMAAVAYEADAPVFGDIWMNLADRITINQYLRNFGDKLITMAKNSSDGRIHPSYNIARAVTGRFSSSRPNAQQLPRDRELLGEFTSVRQSFWAPAGKVLVSLDYSGIELKVLALLTGDEQLLHDCITGDVHAEVASLRAGRKIDKTIHADYELRSAAKGISFGIIYGSGAAGLAATMRSTIGEASDMIESWSRRYPKAFGLRHQMMDVAQKDGFIPVADGGTIYMGKKPDLPKCANYPVQRAALSVMARAIIRHRDTLEREAQAGRQLGTRMAATIHDALIDEAKTRDANRALFLMKDDMVQGYLDVFPNAPTEKLLDGGIGKNWGTLEDVAV